MAQVGRAGLILRAGGCGPVVYGGPWAPGLPMVQAPVPALQPDGDRGGMTRAGGCVGCCCLCAATVRPLNCCAGPGRSMRTRLQQPAARVLPKAAPGSTAPPKGEPGSCQAMEVQQTRPQSARWSPVFLEHNAAAAAAAADAAPLRSIKLSPQCRCALARLVQARRQRARLWAEWVHLDARGPIRAAPRHHHEVILPAHACSVCAEQGRSSARPVLTRAAVYV